MERVETAEEAPEGRWQRKKRVTRRAIKQAALTLALERGLEHLTVDEISEAADVSPRTFFNYFSCKEDALVGEAGEAAAEVRELIAQRPADEPPLRTLRAVLLQSELVTTARSARERTLAWQRLVHAHPTLLARQLAQYTTIERAFAEAMAERLAIDVDDDLRPPLLAALAGSVVRVAMQRWTADSARRPDELIDEAFDVLEQNALANTHPKPKEP